MNFPFFRCLAVLSAFVILTGAAWSAEVREPKIGSAERQAIMETMRGPVSKRVGKRVTFTGSVKISGIWASFDGHAAPSDGVMPKGDGAFDLSLDFFALLRMEKGTWKMLVWGFAGDISTVQEARRKYPDAPKALVPLD